MSRWDRFRRWCYAVAPAFLVNARVRWVLLRRARALARRAHGVSDPVELWQLLSEFPEFLPLQRRPEILAFLQRVARLSPRRICEIGTASGGTTFLLARVAPPGVTVVTLDLGARPGQAEALSLLAGPGRRVVSLLGDSHRELIAAAVRAAVEDEPFDVLLIDGDHRYEGVSQDFQRYHHLVRPGGLIALHDIMPDSRSRGGPDTGTDAGGVPRFWRELKTRYPDAQEIIESPDQDACGIGIIERRDAFGRSPDTSPPPLAT